MVQTVRAPLATFLAQLRERHARRLGVDHAYERMMYGTANPPTPASLQGLLDYLARARPEARPARVPDAATVAALAPLLIGMRWPDPAPLSAAGALLPGWQSLHVSALLHAAIPDYPIWGAPECTALARLQLPAEYVSDPREGATAYGAYIQRIKTLREAARSDQVPESHHYLTRVVQAALEEEGRRAP